MAISEMNSEMSVVLPKLTKNVPVTEPYRTDGVEKGDIVQIVDKKAPWYPALVVVDTVKEWGILAYCYVPCAGLSYIRVAKGKYVKVGTVAIFSDLTGGE